MDYKKLLTSAVTGLILFSGIGFTRPVEAGMNNLIASASDKKVISEYNTYCNARFKYCIKYPALLIPQGEADNGDGQKFISKDGKSELAVWGSINALNQSLKDYAIMSSKDKKISSKSIQKNYFMISGHEKDGRLFYQKTLLKGDEYISFLLIYPENKRAKFNKIADKLFNEFK